MLSRFARTCVVMAAMLTFMICGLWHGARWTLVLWGVLHGIYLVVAKLRSRVPQKQISGWGRVVRVVLVFHLVCFAWLLFRAESVVKAKNYLVSMALSSVPSSFNAFHLFIILLIAAALVVDLFRTEIKVRRFEEWPPLLRAATYTAGLSALWLLGGDRVEPFIYFQF